MDAETYRKRLYQLISIEDESERETALDQIVNDYATYGSQLADITSERDSLQEALTKAESDRDTYKKRWAELVSSETLEPDATDDEEVIDYEKKVFKERED